MKGTQLRPIVLVAEGVSGILPLAVGRSPTALEDSTLYIGSLRFQQIMSPVDPTKWEFPPFRPTR